MSDKKGGAVLKFAGVGLILVLVLAGAAYFLLPKLIIRWLGGDEFRQLASKQLSAVLKTEGELEPLTWSSFTVQSGGFASRPDALGPWLWNIRNVKTEISVRLLLDRILRFSEITIDSVTLSPGTKPESKPLSLPSEMKTEKKSGSELLKDVQIGKILIQNFGLKSSASSSGWGVEGVQVELKPSSTHTDFGLQKGEIVTPLSWLGGVDLDRAKGSYTDPTLILQELAIRAKSGGTLVASGRFMMGTVPQARGEATWQNWAVPGGRIGVGLFEIPAKISGEFQLNEWRSGGPVGSGQVRLVGARLEPGKGSQTILGLLALLTGDNRLQQSNPLTIAQAQFSVQPGVYDVNRITAEAPGVLRVLGQIRVTGQNLNGQIQLGLDRVLGGKVNALAGGECFRHEEGGYLYEAVNLSGTMDRPQNDLEPKLKQALTRTAVRTTVDIIQKATGNTDPNTPAGAAGQILKSLFGPAPK